MSVVTGTTNGENNRSIFERVQSLSFPIGEFVVVGGVLEAHGIRKANDVDVIATDSLFEKLVKEGWKEFPLNPWDQGVLTKKRKVSKDDIDVMTEFSWRKTLILPTPELIRKAEIIRGIPFIPLALLLQWKDISEREKDKNDAILIRDFLTRQRI